MLSGITQEDAFSGSWGEFVGHSGGEIRVAPATKNFEVVVRWGDAKESLVWGAIAKGFGWVKIKKIGGGV